MQQFTALSSQMKLSVDSGLKETAVCYLVQVRKI